MRAVRWTIRAERSFYEWLDYLAGIDGELALRAATEARAEVSKLAWRAPMFRRSRWEGFQELPLRDWRKLVVYAATEDEVVVIAFYDQRQDLTRVHPEPE